MNHAGKIISLLSRASGRAGGFTLLELIVVVVLMVMLMAFMLPSSQYMPVRVESGMNALSVGASTARSISGSGEPFTSGFYSGAGMMVTPMGELRIIREKDPANFVDHLSNPFDITKSGYFEPANREHIQIPPGVGIVGLGGAPGGSSLILISPPFVVRFDPDRRLIWRDSADPDGMVFYNGNCDTSAGKQMITAARLRSSPWYSSAATYNPHDWDPETPGYSPDNTASNNPGLHPTANKMKLPFDGFESVIGVIVYSKKQLAEASKNLVSAVTPGNPINDDGKVWLETNGRTMMFNRYTGTAVKP